MITVFPFATTSRPGLGLVLVFGCLWPFAALADLVFVHFGLGIAWEAGILSLGLGPTHPCSTDVDMEPFSTSVNEVLS